MNEIRSLPCCVCAARPVHLHHVKTRGAGGLDEANLVPLCILCHSEIHTVGRHTFAERHNVDLQKIARALSRRTGEHLRALGAEGNSDGN